MVRFENVFKAFGAKQVLSDVSFEVKQAEALCILGRSGMGKSVTLKLSIALLKPDAGKIWIQDDDIVTLGDDELSRVRRKMGFLFQDAALFDSLSLYDNLALPLKRLTHKTEREVKDAVLAALEQVGLADDRTKMPVSLSGGMRKRAGLARAVVLEPKVLLVDEPNSGLDRLTALEIDELLLQLKQERQVSLIIVTHDIHGAHRVGDRFAVLENGKFVGYGTADEVANSGSETARKLIEE